MSDQIRADYEMGQQLTSRFAGQAQAIGQLLQTIRNNLQPLVSGGWEGRGADEFFAHMEEEMLPATQRLQQVLDDSGTFTKEIYAAFHSAEDEASSLFGHK